MKLERVLALGLLALLASCQDSRRATEDPEFNLPDAAAFIVDSVPAVTIGLNPPSEEYVFADITGSGIVGDSLIVVVDSPCIVCCQWLTGDGDRRNGAGLPPRPMLLRVHVDTSVHMLHRLVSGPPTRSTTMAATTKGPTVIPATGGEAFDFGGLGVEWKIDGADTGGGFSVVHHPIAPRALAAPLHYHHNEDEYSYVLEGTLGALLGDDVVTAGPGTWVYKPRHQWHTFWNAGDTPCRIIEVISPAGFEDYFREAAEAWGDMERFARICEKYRLDIDVESVPELCQRFGVTFQEL